MTEEEKIRIEHRLTEVEQRAKSNTHQIEEIKPIISEIRTMSNTMVELVQELKHTNEAVNSLDTKVGRIDSRVDEMERAPAENAKDAKKIILDKLIGAIAGFLIAGIIWAAVQAF